LPLINTKLRTAASISTANIPGRPQSEQPISGRVLHRPGQHSADDPVACFVTARHRSRMSNYDPRTRRTSQRTLPPPPASTHTRNTHRRPWS
jgi:hypothetical protein